MSRKGNSDLKWIIITAFAVTMFEMDFTPLMILSLCVDVTKYPSHMGTSTASVWC